MEAFAAISLTGNIIQFLDVAADIFKIGSQIRNKRLKDFPYNATSAASKMEYFAELLRQRKYPTCHSEAEATLNEIADECIAIAKELADDMEMLQRRSKMVGEIGHKPVQVAKSFALAIRLMREEPRMQKLSDKLDKHRNLLSSSVMVHMLGRVNIALEELSDVSGQMRNNQGETAATLLSNHSETMEAIRSQANESQKTMLDIKIGIERFKQLLEENRIYPPIPSVFTDTDPSLKTPALHGHQEIEWRFLSWLSFVMMEDREKSVEKVFKETFSWIFDAEDMADNNFKQWLQQSGGIYWISGKAGCGKSTLMKFIQNDVRTRDALQQWAGTDELVTASYLFWAAGTPLQKNQEGLLRALLYPILKRRRDLIPRLFPRRYEAIMNKYYI